MSPPLMSCLPYGVHGAKCLIQKHYTTVSVFFLLQTFHVAGLRLDRPCFLNKSTLACIAFNIFIYVVFVAHLITTEVTDEKTKVGFLCILFSS